MRAVHALAIVTTGLTLSLAASAGAGSAGLSFSSFPKRALQGDAAGITVAVSKARDTCALRVTYSNGVVQDGLGSHSVRNGRVAWTWKVPLNAHTGRAGISVACKSSGRIARPLMVVGAVVPVKIDVVEQGFSVKTPKYGGDSVSYGVILANRSKTDDALDVSVLVNFVNANNVLIGSVGKRLESIRAGGEFALGDSITFPGAAPVARLEVVVRVGGRQPTNGPPSPLLDNVRIVPDLYEPVWVGTVEGEISNRASKILSNASISAVVLDSAGKVVGGGTGAVYETLPPGARQFVKLSSGFTSIPIADAATVQYSIVPRYEDRGV